MSRGISTLFRARPRTTSRPRLSQAARLQMEELELRALPSTFASYLPNLATINADLALIRVDVQHLSTALARSTKTGVAADVKALRSDLAAVSAELTAGKSITQELTALVTDEANLINDLGGSATTTVKNDLRALENNLMGLAKATNTTNLKAALTNVQSAGQLLTTALAANKNSTVVADLQTLNTDLTRVAADLAAGTDASTDLATALADEATLAKDLGTRAARTIKTDLQTLRTDLNTLSTDLTQVANQKTLDVKLVQADEAILALELGSNASLTVSADLATLDAALVSIASDVSAGQDITVDLANASSAELTLVTDLGRHITPALRQTFSALSTDLTRLASELASAKV